MFLRGVITVHGSFCAERVHLSNNLRAVTYSRNRCSLRGCACAYACVCVWARIRAHPCVRVCVCVRAFSCMAMGMHVCECLCVHTLWCRQCLRCVCVCVCVCPSNLQAVQARDRNGCAALGQDTQAGEGTDLQTGVVFPPLLLLHRLPRMP